MLPVSVINFVVPLGDQIMQRAACRHIIEDRSRLAERHAAVHAARALLLTVVQRERRMKFVEMTDALQRGDCFIVCTRKF